MLTAGALIPAALALACNPQAYLTLDKAQYAPGETVRVSGSFFKTNVSIKVSVDRTGQSTTVTTSGNGAFTATFSLPSNAPVGAYGVEAIGFETDGSVTPGLPAPGSFTVAAPQPAPQTSTGGGDPAPAGTPAASSGSGTPAAQPAAPQATRPTARPSTSSSPNSSFREPRVVDEPNVQRSTTGRTTTRRSGSDASVADSGGASTDAGGRTVFGGSVAPSVSVPAAGAAVTGAPAASGSVARSGSASAVSPQAAEQTATDDVWGALGSGRAPSVLPVAGDGVAVSSPRTGSQLALGLVLLGGGVLALIGGLAAGEARSRRVRAR